MEAYPSTSQTFCLTSPTPRASIWEWLPGARSCRSAPRRARELERPRHLEARSRRLLSGHRGDSTSSVQRHRVRLSTPPGISTVPRKVTASKIDCRDDEVYVYGDALRLPCLRLVSLASIVLDAFKVTVVGWSWSQVHGRAWSRAHGRAHVQRSGAVPARW